MFSNRYRYLIIALLALYSFANVLFMEALAYYGLHVYSSYILFLFLIVTLLIWEGNRWVSTRLEGVRTLFGIRIPPVLLSFLLSLPITFLAVTLPIIALDYFLLHLPIREIRLGTKLMLAVGFRINLFLNTLNVIFYFMKQLRETQLEAEQFKKISLQAQFQSLKNQVNPHFLFNNLNVLSSLVYKDQEAASEFIQQLSKVYRYVLQNQEKELIEVSQELEFMESYVYLLRTRFGENLDIHIDVPRELLHYYTVPVALQMLVENAIKHNVSSKNKPLRIEVFAEDCRNLVVRNNLQPKPKVEESTHIGLKNISRRYSFVSSQPVEVARESNWFVVKIPLIQLADGRTDC